MVYEEIQAQEPLDFSDLPSEDSLDLGNQDQFNDAVVHGTDWTTETIINQLHRGNFVLNPSFQRRDAWKPQQKSRFIESLILGLPIPQIVLAEAKDRRGKFIVLDGKQRLLSLLQYWGFGEGPNNGFGLSGLEARKDLLRKRLSDIESDARHEDDFNALLNQPIRTVVIKNWPNDDFLHLVFLRLNTGSVRLSPQELRQALFPGPFSDWIDRTASESQALKSLLNLDGPDYRMRDIEVLARHLAFRFFLADYTGRMKKFLDHSFREFNHAWGDFKPKLEEAVTSFEDGVRALVDSLGDQVGRKPGSKQFNRAIFDFLSFYAHYERVQVAMRQNPSRTQAAYESMFENPIFRSAVERDTASVDNTVLRLASWGSELNRMDDLNLPLPTAVLNGTAEKRVGFSEL